MTDRTLLEAFNDCIDRLATGQTVDAVLGVYPQHADKLGVMLRVANTARGVIEVPPAELAAARERVRATVLEALAAAAPMKPQLSVLPRARRMLAAAAVILMVGFVGALLVLNRQQQQFAIIESLTPPSETPTDAPTVTVTGTPSATVTATETPSPTGTVTEAPPATVTATHTPSPTGTATETPSPTASQTVTDTASTTPDADATVTRTASATRTPTSSKTPTRTPTAGSMTPGTPDPSGCTRARPTNWVVYRVRSGDTVSSLASATGITAQELIRVNCIVNPNLLGVGTELYLPRTPLTNNPSATAGGSNPNPTSGPATPGNPVPTADPSHDDDDDDDDSSGSGHDDDDNNSGSG